MQPMAIEWDALHQPIVHACLATPLPHTPSGHCAQRHRGATETTILGWLAQMVNSMEAIASTRRIS